MVVRQRRELAVAEPIDAAIADIENADMPAGEYQRRERRLHIVLAIDTRLAEHPGIGAGQSQRGGAACAQRHCGAEIALLQQMQRDMRRLVGGAMGLRRVRPDAACDGGKYAAGRAVECLAANDGKNIRAFRRLR